MTTKIKTIQSKFKISLKSVAKRLKVDPARVSKVEFFANDHSKLTEWDLRKAGGFGPLQQMFFEPKEELAERSLRNAHTKGIKSQEGRDSFLAKEVSEAIENVLTKNPPKLHKPVKVKSKAKKKVDRTLVTQWSDLHYGCVISKDEMNGVNEWNWTIAARRTAGMVKCIAEYKEHYRDETDLVIIINGDIIAGVIHNQEWFAEPIATQFGGAVSILSQAVSYLATRFKSVRVVCQSGNHGRVVHKQDKGRSTVHKWDSYETMIYRTLEMYLRSHKNVSFQIDESPYAIFQVQGHNCLATHGDTVFKPGNPGKSIQVERIDTQITKLNTTIMKGMDPLKIVFMGHVHTETYQQTDSGAALFINSCLIGNDPFAQSIGLHNSQPSQWLLEVTKEDAVGDMRSIKVARYNESKELDKIIEPFKGKF